MTTTAVADLRPEEARRRALEVDAEMGMRFNENFELSASKARRELLRDIMKHRSLLIAGQVATWKEINDKCDELQSQLKQGGDEGKGTLADEFSSWLNGGGSDDKARQGTLTKQ